MAFCKELTIEAEKYHIRPYQATDEDAVLSLWQTVFEKDISRAYWRWKYVENPYGNRILLCVNQTGDVVVLYGGIPYRTRMATSSVEIIHLSDIMSHPAVRKTGLFIQTVAAFIAHFSGPEKAAFFYGFPGKYHFDIGQKYLEYRELGDGVAFLSAMVQDFPVQTSSRAMVARISNLDEIKNDDMWNNCREFYPFSVIRDHAFLNWRFYQHPTHSYEVYAYALHPDSPFSGYAVFTLSEDEEAMVLVDLMMPPFADRVQDFFTILSKGFADRNIKRIKTWLPANHFLTLLLVSSGFSVSPEPLGFIPTGRSFSPALPWDWGSWNMFYSMADADLF